ncbi:bone morphogenetic protein receptor type-2-like [Odontesthes bonariensis]|uniref:bone morphogenetic protein receptor type-2-like n=1 Tax=Odontesthes bonariensis TaxID=219752 RepID=UPI003F586224
MTPLFFQLILECVFTCISQQSLLQKRRCVFQVTHKEGHRYTSAGNVSGSVQVCENTSCCLGIYIIINGQQKVDTLACDKVGMSCPDATCKAHSHLNNPFIVCTCNTDLCNSNITLTPHSEEPPHTNSYFAAETTLLAVMGIVVVMGFAVIAIKWRSIGKKKKENLQSSCHDYSLQPLCSCGAKTSQNYITDIEIQQVVGQGHFATVFQGKYQESEVAVKVYPTGWKQKFTTEKEIYELPLMRHGGITHFLGIGRKSDDSGWFIVLEYAKYGSLHSFLCEHTTSWKETLKLCQSLSQGLSYLHCDLHSHDKHKPPVAHRDLSSSNVLVKADGTCVLCDFGCSTILRSCSGRGLWQQHTTNMKDHAQLGTLNYMSPEILEGSVNLSSSLFLMQGDIYALGLLLWEIWMRCSDLFEGAIVPQHLLPYELELDANVTRERLILYVSEMDKRPFIPEHWDLLPQGSVLKELLTDCWDRDMDARLTAPCVVNRLVSLLSSYSP